MSIIQINKIHKFNILWLHLWILSKRNKNVFKWYILPCFDPLTFLKNTRMWVWWHSACNVQCANRMKEFNTTLLFVLWYGAKMMKEFNTTLFFVCDMVQKWWRNSIWHCFFVLWYGAKMFNLLIKWQRSLT